MGPWQLQLDLLDVTDALLVTELSPIPSHLEHGCVSPINFDNTAYAKPQILLKDGVMLLCCSRNVQEKEL